MALGLLGTSVLVLSLVGLLMSRAGVSLRPITWMGGLIRARMAAGGFAPPGNAPLEGASPALAGAEPAGSGLPLHANLAIVFVTLIIIVPYFFKGASWAGAHPRADVTPVDADELRRRLLAINDLDVPFTIAVDSSNNVEATWRWADAKWVDHARAHGVRRTHRVLLRLDPSGHIACVTDYAASFDWSAGPGGGNVAWNASSGINFFEVRKERVFGVPLSGETSWRFDLQELKAPLIQAVTEAGWDWRPVLWGGAPVWLHRLTE